MQPGLWQRAEAVFHAALERPAEARPAFLKEACDSDAELRRQVDVLLSKDEQAGSFLEPLPGALRAGIEALLAGQVSDEAPAVTNSFLRAVPALPVGRRIGPYDIEGELGAGGMGQVYKARDTRLDRTVAIKVLPADVGADPERRARFEREARTIAGLSHPHICTLYDVGDQDGVTFLVMEYIAGETLANRLRNGPLPVEGALTVAIEIADALSAAHRHGLIHRDLKPANVMVTRDGQVKVLDFWLAKRVDLRPDAQSEFMNKALSRDEHALTRKGMVAGTAAYMSPEQVKSEPLDTRSDIFSFGALLYELLTGRRAFQSDSPMSTMSAILRDTPVEARRLRADVPRTLAAIVVRCLEKTRDLRYPSAVELHEALTTCESQLAAQKLGTWALLRKPRFAIPTLLCVAALVAAVAWSFWRSSRVNWARTVALPEIGRLVDAERTCTAFRLVERAERYLRGDPEIERIRKNFMRRASFLSDPPGAEVYVRDYIETAADAPWDYLGRTPLQAVLIPTGHLRYRVSKLGLKTAEGYTASAVTGAVGVLRVKLDREGSGPPGMVRVPAQTPVQEFWLDKYEVTNRQFKEFVVRGGYETADHWQEPFTTGGRTIAWEQAMARFTDTTGLPGPATWEFGTFPEGQGDYPVSGVSWHEAAAYCEFEGKSLPTVHHWRSAAQRGMFATILQTSNFAGRGPARVGSYGGLGPFGTYDGAGNVREWALNASSDRRYILGGAWNDPKYLFYLPDARLPFDRSSGNGFRCAKYEHGLSRELAEPIDSLVPTRPPGEKPVSDAIFRVYRGFHTYDRGELDAKIEATDDASPYWRVEKITLRAGYGNERMMAHLFLPRNTEAPLQTVVTFPGIYAFDIRSSARLETQWFDFIVRSGRAVMHPIYKGTYERTIGATYATCQIPMFRFLGTPDRDKLRIVVDDAGHVAFNQEVIRHVLGWLDKYLGNVKTR